ncbi:MAG: hydrogenase 3 maturation endopeptidase HyCI [bacterium]
MKNSLKEVLKGKVIIVGIGNILRGDDGFGPALVNTLQGNVKAICIDAGAAPENYVGKIAKENPDVVLLADIVHLDLEPGDWRILDAGEIVKSGFTTHDLSPHLIIDYIKQETKAEIYMLGVEPSQISLGSEMSSEVKKAIVDLAELIKEEINA